MAFLSGKHLVGLLEAVLVAWRVPLWATKKVVTLACLWGCE